MYSLREETHHKKSVEAFFGCYRLFEPSTSYRKLDSLDQWRWITHLRTWGRLSVVRKLRAALCKYRESGANSKFQLFRQKEPFGQIFSRITPKSSSALSFWQNRTFPKMCLQTARRSLKLTNFNRLAWRNGQSTGNETWQYFNATSFL